MLVLLALLAALLAPPPAREMAVTLDDLPLVSAVPRTPEEEDRITRALLAALRRHRVPAVGFVNERALERDGAPRPERVALLARWLDAGMELGNHTYSHADLHATPLPAFREEVLRGERVTRPLAARHRAPLRWFRHPFLHTGRDLATRRGLEAFLADHGYRVAPVTVDNYDYVFAAAYDRAGEPTKRRLAAAYLDYMERVVAFYEQQAHALLGRDLRHVLLLHANALNAATLDSLATRLERRGYAFVSLDRALADPAYRSRDEYVGPAGISWLHRWALTQGKRGRFFAGEPEVPAWVEAAARPEAR